LEDALVDPRHVELHPGSLRQILGLAEPIRADIGVQYAPIGLFSARPQSKRFLAFLERLFELPQV